MGVRNRPKTDFGVQVDLFRAQTGINIKELADMAGVKYTTLIDVTTGRTAGHEVVPRVEKAMEDYRETNRLGA